MKDTTQRYLWKKGIGSHNNENNKSRGEDIYFDKVYKVFFLFNTTLVFFFETALIWTYWLPFSYGVGFYNKFPI